MKINKETKKAYQLETSDGKLFWIQKRWMREDGTLTAAGLKAQANAKAPVQGIKLETPTVPIPEPIKEVVSYENLIITSEAKKSGKWIVFEIMSMSGDIVKGSAMGIKRGIKEVTGRPSFIRPGSSNNFATAGWLA